MAEHRSSNHIPDPADVVVSLAEILVNRYERFSKRDANTAQPRELQRIRSAIKRTRTQENLFLLIMSFGFAVGLTCLFLALAGYLKIGNAQLHIAHVLRGGLAVFLRSILMFVLSNQWVYSLSAIPSGVGMG